MLFKAIRVIKATRQPAIYASMGLIVANIMLAFFEIAPLHRCIKVVILAFLIVLPIFFGRMEFLPDRIYRSKSGFSRAFIKYVVAIFAFYFLSGLLYSVELPVYSGVAFASGLENLAYIAGVALSVFLYRYSYGNLPLLVGVFSVALSTSIFSPSNVLLAHAGMFMLQVGYGLIDAFFVMYLISYADIERFFGFGVGIMTLSIGISTLVLKYMPVSFARSYGFLFAVAFLGLFVVAGVPGRRVLHGVNFGGLSEREREVVDGLLKGRKLKEIADEIGISESSVKTYLTRIYRKYGVKNKSELLDKIREKDIADI